MDAHPVLVSPFNVRSADSLCRGCRRNGHSIATSGGPPLTPSPRAMPVAGAPMGLAPPDVLTGQLTTADTPYRAWAAVALLTAAVPRHRAEGRRLVNELADSMQEAAQLQHADLVGYALLDGAGVLAPQQQEELRAALPRPNRERTRRAKLYGSSTYVYLLARGVGVTLAWRADLVRHIDEELERVIEHVAPDLVELALLVAARLELAGVIPLPDESLRRLRGRVMGAGESCAAAVALRWLLELYGARWPAGVDAESLRHALRTYAESAGSDIPPADDRLALLAMQLEVGTRRDPEFRLTTRADRDAALAAHLGRRRVTEGAAYLLAIAVVAGGPAMAAVNAGWLVPMVGWAAALGWGIPAAVWATLVVLGRRRDVMVLGTGVVIGLAYAAMAFYAGGAHKATWMPHLVGEGAMLGLFSAVVSAVVAGVKAARTR